jgi:O-antigen/teichoic acid export membrane protein
LLQTWLFLLDLGMTPALSREMARFKGGAQDAQSIRDLLRSVEVIGFGAAILIVLGIGAASDWLASEWLRVEKLPVDTVAQAFAIMGVVTALRFVENIYRGSMIGLQRQVMLNVVSSVAATARALGAVAVLLWISPTITAFFVWQGVISGATVVAFALALYGCVPRAARAGRFSLTSLQGVWRFAVGTLTLTVLGFLLSQSDKLVLTRLLSLKEFAYYSLAFAVASSVRLLAQPVDQGIYPRLTELLASDDKGCVIRTYHQGAQFSVVLMGSVAAFLAIFGENVLRLWTQDPELSMHASPIMALLVIGMLLNGLLSGPFYLQMAAGWTGLLVRVNAVLVVVFVPVIYFLVTNFGAMGAAAAWLTLNVAYLLVVVPLMHKRLLREEMWKWFINDISFPLLAAFAMLTALKVIMPSGLHTLLLILFLGGALVASLASSALAASYVRMEIFSRFGKTAAWPA